MITTVLNSMEELMGIIHDVKPRMIVLEGYDGVGKTMLCDQLAKQREYPIMASHCDKRLREIPGLDENPSWRFHVDWIQQPCGPDKCVVWDRSAISGAVYNYARGIGTDPNTIMMWYDQALTCNLWDINAIHVLVTCDKWRYRKNLEDRQSRGEEIDKDIELEWTKYKYYTDLYRHFMKKHDIMYVEYKNE